jgi:hypothetical protein
MLFHAQEFVVHTEPELPRLVRERRGSIGPLQVAVRQERAEAGHDLHRLWCVCDQADLEPGQRREHRAEVRGNPGRDLDLRVELERLRDAAAIAHVRARIGAVRQAERRTHPEREPLEHLTARTERHRHRGQAIGVELRVQAVREVLLSLVHEERVALHE